jgi:hypothetical protein
MVAFTMRFDPIEYSQRLRNVGFSQEQAEIQAQTMECVLETAKQMAREEVNLKDVATQKDILMLQKNIADAKADLELKIAVLRNDLFRWVVTVGISSSVIIIGAMATLLKLFIH